MRSEEFNEILQNRIATSVGTLVKKAGEYAEGEDRLHAFRRAAALRGQSMREALGGMMLKHTVSIYDMIDHPEIDYPQEVWDEKLGDHINYLFLLDAVIWDEKNSQADQAEAASDVSVGEGPVSFPSRALSLGFSQEQIDSAKEIGFTNIGYQATEKGYLPVLFAYNPENRSTLFVRTTSDFSNYSEVERLIVNHHGETI